MSTRPEPYLTRARPWRWAWVLWIAGLILALTMAQMDLAVPDGLLGLILGLAFLAEGIDAIRTGRAQFAFSAWYLFEAGRADRPIRFWVFFVLNVVAGALLLYPAVLSAEP